MIVTCVSGEGVCGDKVMRNLLQALQESTPDSRKIKVFDWPNADDVMITSSTD